MRRWRVVRRPECDRGTGIADGRRLLALAPWCNGRQASDSELSLMAAAPQLLDRLESLMRVAATYGLTDPDIAAELLLARTAVAGAKGDQ